MTPISIHSHKFLISVLNKITTNMEKLANVGDI